MTVTTAVLKLNHGGASLNLMSGRYMSDFVPPDSDVTFATSSGTIGNQLEGAEAIGWSAKNRSISFRVRVLGDSEREISRGIQDVRAFINRGSEGAPVTLESKPNSDTPRPSWGQDGTRYYEVVTFGSIALDPLYGSRIREKAARFIVTVIVTPYALGLPQIAAHALGAIHHDTPGSTDGRDRGIIVTNPTSNLVINPIFANPTYNAGWSTNAAARVSENTNPAFILYGNRSARVESVAANADFYVTTTITTAVHVVSFYAKRSDGGTIDSTILSCLYISAAVSSTYESVGDGWYRVRYSAAGSAAPASYGARVLLAGMTVYFDGFMLELGVNPTPVLHGDMYGGTWTGTAHYSTTDRTTGRLRLPLTGDVFSSTTGSARFVVTFPVVPLTTAMLFDEAATRLRAYFDGGTTNTWIFTDNTNTISGGGAVSAGSTYVVHVVWTNGRLQMYLNGSSIASGGTFTPASAAPTYLYIGTSPTPLLHNSHVFNGATIWTEPLTTAQVLADYTNIAPLVTDRQRVSEIPYIWSETGDGTLHVYDDNTYTNWGVIAGVPGTAPADTTYKVVGNGGDTGYLGLWDTREFIKPTRILYQDNGGTADANSSGGSYRRTTPAAATETDINTSTVLWVSDPKLYRFVADREWFAIVRMRIASGTGKLRQRLKLSSTIYVDDIHIAAAPVTYFKQVLLPPLYFPLLNSDTFTYPNLGHYITTVNSGATVNTDFDFYCLFPRRMVTFTAGTTIMRGHAWATEYEFPASSVYEAAGVTSESLDPLPDTYNVMLVSTSGGSYVGTDSGASAGLQLSIVTITPRYALG